MGKNRTTIQEAFRVKLLLRIAVVFSCLVFTSSLFAEPIRQTERHYEGPPKDGILRQTPIFPWDDQAALSDIKEQIERLEQEGVPEAFLTLAMSTDTEPSQTRNREIYTRDRTVLNLLFPDSEDDIAREKLRAARYVMFHSALEGRPYVLYNLGNSLYRWPDPAMPKDFHLTLWRLAADREMLPALVNFIATNRVDVSDLNADMAEAYLRYGFDLGAPGGEYQLVSNLVEFYGHYHTNREDDGYFRRALDRLSELGATAESKEWEAFARLDGYHLQQDVPLGLDILTSLLAEPDPRYHHYVTIGYAYANGNGVPRDLDLARDIYVACLRASQEAGCAHNLGSYFVRPSEGVYKPILANALYFIAEKLASEQGAHHVVQLAQAEQEHTKADFPIWGAHLKLNQYITLIENGQFEDIEELSGVRPFPRPDQVFEGQKYSDSLIGGALAAFNASLAF